MTRKLLTILLIIMLSAGSLLGQVYFQYMGLENASKNTARSLSLGGNSLALEQNPVAGLNNPAMLFKATDALVIYSNLNMASFIERRSFPVQDSFGDYLAENDYVSNRFQKMEGDLAIYYSQKGFSATVGWYSLENFKYDYQEEIRSDMGSGAYIRDPLAGYHKISFSGMTHGYNLALAHDIGDRFAIGYAYTSYYGSGFEEGYGVIPILSDNKLSSQDTTYFPANATKGVGSSVNLGLTAKVTDRFQLGLHGTLAGIYTMEGTHMIAGMDSSLLLPAYTVDTDSAYKVIIDRPNTYSLSLRYIPNNELKTTLFAQFDITDWRSYAAGYFNSADSLVSLFAPAYSPSWALRAGIEHVFFTGIPFRFGFTYEKNPMNNDMNRSTINVGSGWASDNLTLDVGILIYQNMYYYSDLFPVEDEVRTTLDKVKENGLRVNISLSYSF
ncbi:MAG: hypothetical protein U9O95_08555 [Candidatus Marinimicrobia bacterium]|nr:hypothetical protein [Candidatus Neomarinimicrobiota bacterium]